MNVFVGEEQERYAAEMCLKEAVRKLKTGDEEIALHRAEEAVRSLKALQEIKKAN